ncbi:NAD(P)/FAD-dependent oxidoreductase [Candidatus Halobonum tyrrellensis]|uniref:Udp-galactopyranose mutase n=1 Tax=Candidatus Halobonum tyrrellensis G22 TaxID=1324957 RepID=V4HHU5_9EURY|nr:NAD(P)/FAD-dependent oxidoreductase [Candidatus Halobonum tyrrellensis]ESP89313.1 udp-galactopyranose mutase [Candidatus Halobonum tyrrellensis G22]
MPDSVVVAGAGLAGLVAARHLADAGADVTVYERRDAVGGRVRSRERDGFVLDRGFQVLFTGYPAVERELDLDALDLRTFSPGAVICSATDGTRSALADPLRDPGSLVESALNRRVTTSDKLRTLALRRDLSKRPESWFFSGPDESIEEFLRGWGFSEQYRRNFVAPFYGGITLDRSLSTSKHVFAYTFRALSAGDIALPADGMGAVTRQLADRARAAGAEVVLGEAVEAVDPAEGGVRVEMAGGAVDADAAVVATDPPTARELTGVESIPTEGRPSVTQYYALPDDSTLSTDRKILLNADDDAPNIVVPLTDVAPEYAPDGSQLLCATFLGEEATERDADALAADTRAALSAWFPERNFDGFDRLRTERLRFAQFDQPPGVHPDLPDVTAPDGPVFLAGEYTAWSSIQGAMASGRSAAEALLTERGLTGTGPDGERADGSESEEPVDA